MHDLYVRKRFHWSLQKQNGRLTTETRLSNYANPLLKQVVGSLQVPN